MLSKATDVGSLHINSLRNIREFEWEMMLERQKEGIRKAKEEGKYKGRKPTAMAKAAEVRELLTEGVSKRGIAQRLGISERSVYRIVADAMEGQH